MARAPGTTTEELVTVDGVVLNTFAKNIESLAKRLSTPSKRGSNITLPGRHGSLRTAGKKFDENVIVLPMWVVGCDDNGLIPTGQTERTMFFQNVDALSHLFMGRDDLLDVRHVWPTGEVRQCFAEVLDAIDFSSETARPIGKFGVSLTIPGAFWQSLDEKTQTVRAAGTTANFSSFRGATAPMEDLAVTIVGPWTNPKLTFLDGSWLQYAGPIAAGQSLTVNAGTWTLSADGFVPDLSKLTYSGPSSHWFSLPPTKDEDVIVKLAGTARTEATQLALSGRRKFLVG